MKTLRTLAIALAILVSFGAAQAAVKPAKPAPEPAVKPSPQPAKPAAPKPSALFPAREDFRWGFIDKTGKIVFSGYEDAGEFSEGLAPVKLDGKYGFADITGKMIVAPRFDGAGKFSEGLAPVKVENAWGYADKTGNIVIPPKYAKASEFSEGLAVVEIDDKCGAIDKTGAVVIQPIYLDMARASERLIAVMKDGKWGFIDKTEAVVIAPQFTRADRFSGGLAPAQSGDKWGFIDKTGKWVVQPKYDDAQPFSEGLAAVGTSTREMLRDDEGRVMKMATFVTWGYIDTTGKEVIPLELRNVGPFSEGLAPAWKGEGFGFIDKTGAMVVVSPFDASTGGFHSGLAKTNIGSRYGYINEAGKVVIPQQFPNAEAFSEGLAAVQFHTASGYSWKTWGYIDTTGRMVIKSQFMMAFNFRNGFARVRGDINWGVIDKTGKFALELQFRDIGWLTDKVIAAKPTTGAAKNLWGFFDWSGKAVLEPRFESASFLGDSLAIVKKGGKYGVVDASGALVIPTQYDDTGWLFSEGLLPVSVGSKFGFIDAAGKQIVDPQYDAVAGFTPDGLCAVKVADKWGFIDRNNTPVIPPRYDTAVCFSENLAAVKVGNVWGFVDKTGKSVVEPRYALVGNFNRGLAPVLVGDKWGYVDKTGKLVIPARFDNALDFENNLAQIRLGNQTGYIDTTGKAVWMSRKYATASVKAAPTSHAIVRIDGDGARVLNVKVAADQVLRERSDWRAVIEKRMQAVSDIFEKSFKIKLAVTIVPWVTPDFKDSDDPDKYRYIIQGKLAEDVPLEDAEIIIGITGRSSRSRLLGFSSFYYNWLIIYDPYNGADKEEEIVSTITHELCHQFGAFHVAEKTSIMNAFTYNDIKQNTFDQYTTRHMSVMRDYDFAKRLDSLSKDKISEAAAIHQEGRAPNVPFPVASAYMYRGNHRLWDGDKIGATRDYFRALELNGGEPDLAVVYKIGKALIDDGQLAPGIETLRKCRSLKTDPEYAGMYHNHLADDLAARIDDDATLLTCRQASKPKLGEIYRRYVLTRVSPDEVIYEYREAVKASPKEASYHSKLGQALLNCGRLDEAVAEYEQAAALEPDNTYYKSRVEAIRGVE
ncbi:MAG: WG repeat-containing protein [Armatimonadota bacterium]|nr:WG repeat-containing protein [Armatimonadota bacterium]